MNLGPQRLKWRGTAKDCSQQRPDHCRDPFDPVTRW